MTPRPRPDWLSLWQAQPKKAMLFDLDGTLLDTAPDLGGAANRLRARHNLPPLAISELRPFISQGARGMITKGMGVTEGEPRYEALRDEFLAIYTEHLVVDTVFWEGMEEVVNALEAQNIAWGIVTNKIMRFTEPLLKKMNLWDRCAVVVGGDTAGFAKPHPAPMQHAMNAIGLTPPAVVYVGDDLRDIQSGFAAGTWTIACDFGHHVGEPLPRHWGADHVIGKANELIGLVK
jgi:N-acetyl-D-muramate 6-phosphate phosphatase